MSTRRRRSGKQSSPPFPGLGRTTLIEFNGIARSAKTRSCMKVLRPRTGPGIIRSKRRSQSLDEFNIDHVTPGIANLRSIGLPAMRNTAARQLRIQPRTRGGVFWHRKIYPSPMWLDGFYMGEPFCTEYSKDFGEDNWNDIADQFVWMEKPVRDPKKGFLYRAWDESKEQRWANKQTRQSPHFWGRAMVWYAMALGDSLAHFPKDHPRRKEVIDILNRWVTAIEKVQDPKSGVWRTFSHLAERKRTASSVQLPQCSFLPLPAAFALDTCRKGQ